MVLNQIAKALLWEATLPEASFGNYQLIELLGRGGMGEVWRAHDTVIDRTVAIKILPAEISKDAMFQERFRREAHAAARLNSPHIVPIHTHGEVDGRLFVDMRLIEGTNLQSIVENGPLVAARAVRIIEQIAKALHAAHKIGLLHRDVKPSNILIDDDDDYAYLIDFGIALTIGERGLTTVGDVIGTFHYMAPERFKPHEPDAPPVDARSDIYALACVLYECLTGRQPFPGDDLEHQVANHLVSPPPRPSKTNPGLGRGFDPIIAKGMAKDPRDRYRTAGEFARAARGVVTMPMPMPPSRVRQPTALEMIGARTESFGSGQIPAPLTDGVQTTQRRVPDTGTRARPEPPVAQPRREPVAERPPVAPPQPAAPPKPAPPWWRRRTAIISGAALLAVVAVAITVVFGFLTHDSTHNPRQKALPFSGLRKPEGLTVDSAGNVYVADTLHNTVWKLPAGGTKPFPLNFDVSDPTGVTTDNAGDVYVNDAGNKRVVVLPAGQTTQIPLNFPDLGHPTGLTVDTDRTVYVTDTTSNKVWKLRQGATEAELLPFTGLNAPTGLTMDEDGTIYVADGGNNRVLALPRGSKNQTVVDFEGLKDPGGVTVDSHGALYVTDSEGNRALKLPVGSTEQVVLPFTGLDYPWGLAVDHNGTVYVAGHNDKILALSQT
jgi:serine/threonine protein kinase, bacterial